MWNRRPTISMPPRRRRSRRSLTVWPVDDEAERLASYLDAQAEGRPANPDGLDPELVALIEQVTTLNARSTPDPTLKPFIWRTVMTASSTLPQSNQFSPAPAVPRRLPSRATS